MARSLATWDPAPIVAAAAAWIAAGAVVVAVPASLPRAVSIPAVAAHRAASAPSPAWSGAKRVYDEVDQRARRLRPDDRARIARAILEESARAELAPVLVLAVIEVESGYDAGAVSPSGAMGLMQLMMPTLRQELALAGAVAADPRDPVSNVRAGVRYLGRLVGTFSSLELALMAYNAGPNRIRRHLGEGGVPSRFHGYPRDVLRRLARLAPSPREPVLLRARAARPTVAAAHRTVPPPAPFASPEIAHARGLVASPPGAACVRLEPALPIFRGRDRPRPVERTLPS